MKKNLLHVSVVLASLAASATLVACMESSASTAAPDQSLATGMEVNAEAEETKEPGELQIVQRKAPDAAAVPATGEDSKVEAPPSVSLPATPGEYDLGPISEMPPPGSAVAATPLLSAPKVAAPSVPGTNLPITTPTPTNNAGSSVAASPSAAALAATPPVAAPAPTSSTSTAPPKPRVICKKGPSCG